MTLLLSCGYEAVDALHSGGDPTKSKQVRFDRDIWISAGADLQMGTLNPRVQMREAIMSDWNPGRKLYELLETLGTPDLVRRPEDFDPAAKEKLPSRTVMCVSYTVFLSSDGWPLDLSFYFDKDGELIDVREEYR